MFYNILLVQVSPKADLPSVRIVDPYNFWLFTFLNFPTESDLDVASMSPSDGLLSLEALSFTV